MLFNRLHTSAVTVIDDSCSGEAHNLEQADGDQVVEGMPKVFSNFAEAHRYFMYIMKRCALFVQIAVRLGSSASSTSAQQAPASTVDWLPSLHTPFPSGSVPPNILVAYEKHLHELRQWQSAFNPLRLNPDRANQAGVVVMQPAASSIRLIIKSVIARNECYWDQFLPEYRAIVSLSKAFFRTLPKEASLRQESEFSMEMSIVPPLYVVCKYCRDGQVRREAIALMKLCPRREGIWDSGLTAKVSIFLMEVEEEGLVNGYIPEDARARISKVSIDVLTKMAAVECMKRIPDTEGGIMIRKTTIAWD